MYTAGKFFYLIGLAELAIYNFFKGDFAMTRPPALPAWLSSVNPTMAYVSGVLLLLCIAAVLLNKFTSQAIITIVVIVLLCATTRHIAGVWKDPVNGFKTLWLIGGALLLWPDPKYRASMVFMNTIFLVFFFYHCAIAHFQYGEMVQFLIPSFIPFKLFFTYFAGICLLLAAIGLLIPKLRSLSALLSAIQITGWFLLLHIPRALTNKGDEWIGVGESLAVAGICFMLHALFTPISGSLPGLQKPSSVPGSQ